MYGWMFARKIARFVTDVERDMSSIMESLNAVARDAARATALAAVQVERVDRLFADLSVRVEQTAATVQKAIITFALGIHLRRPRPSESLSPVSIALATTQFPVPASRISAAALFIQDLQTWQLIYPF